MRAFLDAHLRHDPNAIAYLATTHSHSPPTGSSVGHEVIIIVVRRRWKSGLW